MNSSLENYLFLSQCIPLPLSVLKRIEDNPSHPFHKINILKSQEIKNELINISRSKRINIKNVEEKAENAFKLINNSILDKISKKIEDWKKLGINIITYFEKKFPSRLKTIKNAPKLLFVKGNYEIDYKRAISIIGTRNPSEYGKNMAFKIGKCFAEKGFVIINGFAKGVDIEAIKGALEGGGKIVSVFGSGLLNPYPKENISIFNEILTNNKGFFISEQLPEKSVVKSALATRNRISSALSLGNVFIEASETSGTKWQLKYSKEQSKSIIVLKPKEKIKQSELPRYIINSEKTAYIIETVKDIDQIVESLINSKSSKETSLTDFI